MVILAVGREDGKGEDVCGDEWQAVVRKEDVRATEKEKVVCGEGFRVGDIVRGVVVCDYFPFHYVVPAGWERWNYVSLAVGRVWLLIVLGGVLYRSVWVISRITICLRRGTSLASL